MRFSRWVWTHHSLWICEWVGKRGEGGQTDRSSGIFSSPEPKAPSELIGWGLSRASVLASVRVSTLTIMNISKTSWPIKIKFHLEHHWGGGLVALGVGPDRIRTLVSMATGSSHRVIM